LEGSGQPSYSLVDQQASRGDILVTVITSVGDSDMPRVPMN
jgi:hypothetical protein